MARDGDIDLSYILTAEMHTECFTTPLPNPSSLKHCAANGMIGIGLRNGLGNGLGNGLENVIDMHRHRLGTANDMNGNALRNGYGNGFRKGIGKGIRKAIGTEIDRLGKCVSRRSTLLDCLLFLFVYCFSSAMDLIAILEKC
jgi:hypothetical protein